MKYNLACGNDKIEGWVNVDIGTVCKPDIVANLLKPEGWLGIPDNSADEVKCRHFVEHIPHVLKHTEKDGLIWFMEQLYKACQDGCVVHLSFPHPFGKAAFSDPTHCRTLDSMTISYFSSVWREVNCFGNYGIVTDFEITSASYGMFPPWSGPSPELEHALLHNVNIAWEIVLELKAHKPIRKNA